MPTDILSSSRRKRRKKLAIKAGLILLGVIILLCGIVAIFYIPKFRINNVSFEGMRILEAEELQNEIKSFLKSKFLKVFPYDNIFLLPKEKFGEHLYGKFPVLKKIAIKRDFPQKISIFIEERKPNALWCRSLIPKVESFQEATSTLSSSFLNLCAFVDGGGFIFYPAPEFSGAIFLKFFDERKYQADIGKQMLEAPQFINFVSFAELMKKKNFLATKIVLKDGGVYEIYLKEGWYVLLNNENEAGLSFSNLELVLNETIKEKRPRLEYIDLRFGKKVFYKLK